MDELPMDNLYFYLVLIIYFSLSSISFATSNQNKINPSSLAAIMNPNLLDSSTPLIAEAKEIISSNTVIAHEQPTVTTQTSIDTTLDEIKKLREQGNLSKAKILANEHLKQHPQDNDVRLILGLIEYQLKEYQAAEQDLTEVINAYPNYTDAKIALIKTQLAEKKYVKANSLYNQTIKENPQNKELKELKKNLKKTAKKSHRKIHFTTHKQKPSIIAIEIQNGHLHKAMHLIDENLKFNPNDPDLLSQKSKIFFLDHLYAQAAFTSKESLSIDPKNIQAKEIYSLVQEIDPNKTYGLNEIGIYSLNYYVSDLKAVWDFSTLFYSRETTVGLFSIKLNYANRLGAQAPQLDLAFSPVFNPYFYLDIDVTYANKPALFPHYSGMVEGYVTIPQLSNVTFSLGGYHGYILKSKSLERFTASLSRSFGQWLLGFRVNHYDPYQGPNSDLYLGTIRKYFGNNDCYFNLSIGGGTSPDLSDLQTLNFLVIQNKFAAMTVRIPLFNYRTLLDLGVDYANWKYPSGRIRNLYGVSAGLSYRF